MIVRLLKGPLPSGPFARANATSAAFAGRLKSPRMSETRTAVQATTPVRYLSQSVISGRKQRRAPPIRSPDCSRPPIDAMVNGSRGGIDRVVLKTSWRMPIRANALDPTRFPVNHQSWAALANTASPWPPSVRHLHTSSYGAATPGCTAPSFFFDGTG
jgi:hypothetical protein